MLENKIKKLKEDRTNGDSSQAEKIRNS